MEQPLDPENTLPETAPAAFDQPEHPVIEDFDADPLRDSASATPESLEAVHDVPVKVQAVLGRSRMPVGKLLRLSVGTVVELDRRVGEPVDIFVNNRLIARGEVVLIDGSLGVTLTEIVRSET